MEQTLPSTHYSPTIGHWYRSYCIRCYIVLQWYSLWMASQCIFPKNLHFRVGFHRFWMHTAPLEVSRLQDLAIHAASPDWGLEVPFLFVRGSCDWIARALLAGIMHPVSLYLLPDTGKRRIQSIDEVCTLYQGALYDLFQFYLVAEVAPCVQTLLKCGDGNILIPKPSPVFLRPIKQLPVSIRRLPIYLCWQMTRSSSIFPSSLSGNAPLELTLRASQTCNRSLWHLGTQVALIQVPLRNICLSWENYWWQTEGSVSRLSLLMPLRRGVTTFRLLPWIRQTRSPIMHYRTRWLLLLMHLL